MTSSRLLGLVVIVNSTCGVSAFHSRARPFSVGTDASGSSQRLQSDLHDGLDHSHSFDQYLVSFNRRYRKGSEEYGRRGALFHRRLELIQNHNGRAERRWTAGLSTLTDRTDEELAQLRGWRRGAGGGGHGSSGVSSLLAERADVVHEPAERVDWRSLSMAAEVPDQGECGSCWAVAAATMIQGRYELKVNGTRTFSAQQLVDCVPNPNECGGRGGCDGATVELAMEYVQEMGLQDESKAPYSGKQTHCTKPPTSAAVTVGSATSSFLAAAVKKSNGGAAIGLQRWYKLPENRALPLMHAAMEGPVAISIAASDWFLYNSGIFDGCARDTVIDHAVTLFGYGHQNGENYWLIRNSWGKEWGEQGFIRLLRQNTPQEDDDHCGVDADPKSGVACRPYPKAVRVCGMCGLLYDSVSAQFGEPAHMHRK